MFGKSSELCFDNVDYVFLFRIMFSNSLNYVFLGVQIMLGRLLNYVLLCFVNSNCARRTAEGMTLRIMFG